LNDYESNKIQFFYFFQSDCKTGSTHMKNISYLQIYNIYKFIIFTNLYLAFFT
jgi:hypothetical protein